MGAGGTGGVLIVAFIVGEDLYGATPGTVGVALLGLAVGRAIGWLAERKQKRGRDNSPE